MATLLIWSFVDMFTALTILYQFGYGSAQSSLSSSINNVISPTTTSAPLPTTTSSPLMMSSSSSMVVETPSSSAPPLTTTEDPVQRHLALIIGVPTGVGLSIIGLSLCMLWLACSSYCEYRKSLPSKNQPNTAGGATRSTNAPANTNSYGSKSGSMPMKPTAAGSTSASESQAFQPVPDPEPEPDPLQLEPDPAPDELLEVETDEREDGREVEDSDGHNSQAATPPPISSS